jgi:hypothetical protein
VGSASFEAALDRLSDAVGHERVRGKVEVDQVYARYQHEGLDFKHPRGGQAKYLEQPLYANVALYMRDIAARVLPDGDVVRGMADAMEDLSGEVFDKAPIEFLDLRASAHPTVRQGGIVYDRPPMQARLTEQQLRAKHKLRRIGGGDRYGF